MRRFLLSAVLAAALLPTAASALEAKQKVFKEVTTIAADGSESVTLAPADRVTPGDKIVYRLDFTNTNAEAATDLTLAMPVPDTLIFEDGSADREGAIVAYSADGGASFAERSALLRPAVGGGTRPVRDDEITHVRWTIAGPVEVGETDSVSYKARLR